MKLFNAFQAVVAFAGWPFLVGWLSTNPFPLAGIAMAVSVIVYIVGFTAMVGVVYDGMGD